MNEVSRRPRSTAAERALWKQRFLQSGLLLREFAAQQGMKLSTAQRWAASSPDISTEISGGVPIRSRPNSPPAAPLFAEVHWPLPASASRHFSSPASASTSSSAMSSAPAWADELVRPDGSSLRLARHVSPPMLKQLFKLLLRAC
jgi:hypothetical protein